MGGSKTDQILQNLQIPCFQHQFAMLEEKLALVSLLRHFQVQTLRDCHPSPEIILKANPGVFVRLQKRF